MTEKLFDTNPYLKEFDAVVLEVDGNRVVLDRTAFYAENGGQTGDTGRIGQARVIDTQYDGDKIVHIFEEHSLKQGDKVHCMIDWDRRYKVMRLHSAAHIVYEFFLKKWGKQKVIGSNISESKARLDFAMDQSVGDSLPEIEENVNRFTDEGHGISTKDDLEKAGFRWWECGEFKMPCGGTHVKSSSEIGKVNLKRKNLGSGKERIEVYLS